MPETDGVPFIIKVLEAQEPLIPVGKPLYVAPVAPVVKYVILVIAVLMHFIWFSVPGKDDSKIVLSGVTVMVPVFVTVLQPPVNEIV